MSSSATNFPTKLQYKDFVRQYELSYKDHQEAAVEWCLARETKVKHVKTRKDKIMKLPAGHGGLIADEMGLGKTIQAIGLMHANPKPNTLIVCPKALVEQWEAALKKLTPQRTNIINYQGSRRNKVTTADLAKTITIITYGELSRIKSRKQQAKDAKPTVSTTATTAKTEAERINEMLKAKVMAKFDEEEDVKQNLDDQDDQDNPHQPPNHFNIFASPIHKVNWHRVIYDEAHHLRNKKTAIHKAAMNIRCQLTWLMTGTPIQNRFADFQSLCEVIGIPTSLYFSPTTHSLKTLVKTYILKRTKQGLKIPMPTLTEEVITVEWQSKEEQEVAEMLHARLGWRTPTRATTAKATTPATKTTTTRAKHDYLPDFGPRLVDFLRARQMCVYPKIIQKAIEKADDEEPETEEHTQVMETVKVGVQGSSKLDAVIEKIVSANATNTNTNTTRTRKLVFCEFRQEMDYLERNLANRNIFTARIDGSTPLSLKKAIIASPHPEVLLLQIRTCSEGLNLQQYTQVYIVTPQWNPSVEAQAVCRSYRIGQTEPVQVYRFVMAHKNMGISQNMETHIQTRQTEKQEIANEVFQ